MNAKWKTFCLAGLLCAGSPALAQESDAPGEPVTGVAETLETGRSPLHVLVPLPDGGNLELKMSGFFDGYAQQHVSNPSALTNENSLRAYTLNNGFALSMAGINVQAEAGPVAGVLGVRFGPTADLAYGTDNPGLKFLEQAYVSWSPTSWLSLDFGRVSTLFGAEVVTTYQNMNYTRGLVFQWAQPVLHHGVRGSVGLADGLAFNFLVANGYGVMPDFNASKNVGLQLSYGTGPFGLAVGYFGGSENNDVTATGGFDWAAVGRLRHLVDVVGTYGAGPVNFYVNGDWVVEDTEEGYKQGGGVGVAGQYAWKQAALSVRTEAFYDPDRHLIGRDATWYGSVTATADYIPVSPVLFRLEGRTDFADRPVFGAFETTAQSQNMATLIGSAVFHVE